MHRPRQQHNICRSQLLTHDLHLLKRFLCQVDDDDHGIHQANQLQQPLSGPCTLHQMRHDGGVSMSWMAASRCRSIPGLGICVVNG